MLCKHCQMCKLAEQSRYAKLSFFWGKLKRNTDRKLRRIISVVILCTKLLLCCIPGTCSGLQWCACPWSSVCNTACVLPAAKPRRAGIFARTGAYRRFHLQFRKQASHSLLMNCNLQRKPTVLYVKSCKGNRHSLLGVASKPGSDFWVARKPMWSVLAEDILGRFTST